MLFSKVASGATGRRGGRKRTYLTCLSLALKNFSVTMQECKDMTRIDWEFLIDNQALETATRKWRGRPCALKAIDNFWAPSIKSRGKRKRIAIAEEDEEDGPEEFIEEVVHQEGIALNTMSVASGGNEIGERASNRYLQLVKQRSPRKRKYRRLRSANRIMDRSIESTQQVFPVSPTANYGYNNSRHNSNISTPTRTAKDKKNQQAAEEFIKKLYQEGKLIDDEEVAAVEPQTHGDTGIQLDNGSAPRRNIAQSAQEKYDAQKKRNFERHQKRRVATTRRVPTAVTARVDNLQLFIGNGGSRVDNTNEHSIVWEHRAQLGQTRAD